MSASHQHVRSELQAGHVWVRMNSGKYWRLRCNGATQLWKRDSFRYRIPVKAGLKVYGEITNADEIGAFDSNANLIYSSADPNTCPHRKAILAAR